MYIFGFISWFSFPTIAYNEVTIDFLGSRNIDEITKFVGDVDAERDESGNTALILAAKNGSEWSQKIINSNWMIQFPYLGNNEIVDLLIQKGANINATSKYDHTALIRAAWHGNEEIPYFTYEI